MSLIFLLISSLWSRIDSGFHLAFQRCARLVSCHCCSVFLSTFHDLDNSESTRQLFCRMSLDLSSSDVFSWLGWAYAFGASLLKKCCCVPLSAYVDLSRFFKVNILRLIGGYAVSEWQNPDVKTGVCLWLCHLLTLFGTGVRNIWKGTLWKPVLEAFAWETDELGLYSAVIR